MSGLIGRDPNMNSGLLGKYPSSHIIQTVNATVTNSDTGTTSSSTRKNVADIINQITINSGNSILVQWTCRFQINGTSNHFGMCVISEGTVSSRSTDLCGVYWGDNDAGGISYHSPNIIFIDPTPASTTPSYVLSIERQSGATASCNIVTTNSTTYEFSNNRVILSEIQA